MPIRTYQPGDEHAQARIYNTAAGSLPGFKPATAEEIGRRDRGGDTDPESRYYAVENGEVVGYAVFGSNGRISYPWCLPGAETLRQSLLETMLLKMRKRGIPEAWTAYRADWSPVHEFLHQHEFTEKRQMINYVADVRAASRRGSSSRQPGRRASDASGSASADRDREWSPGRQRSTDTRRILLGTSVLQFLGEPVRGQKQ